MLVFFRCDASQTLGIGHLMRCRSLAYALRQEGAQCIMVGPSLEYCLPADKNIFNGWLPKPGWNSSQNDAKYLISCVPEHPLPGLIILDDYRIDEQYQQILLKAGLRWLQFDRKADRFLWADWVVNANPATCQRDYSAILQKPGSIALVGPRYAVLRPEFSLGADYIRNNNNLMNVLVTFGGGDDRGAILFTLQSLLPTTTTKIRFHVISGAQNPRNTEIGEWIRSMGENRVTLHINPVEVAPIFFGCDLAIIAGGTTTFEAAACGLPMILITTAENQVDQARAWHDQRAAVYLGKCNGVNAEELVQAFSRLTDMVQRRQMGDIGKNMVDGKGAKRIAQILMRSVDFRR